MEQSGGETPAALLNRPIPSEDALPYWQAFQTLTGSRQWTQAGPLSIPYPTVINWLNENFVSEPDDREDYLQIIQQLDSVYLDIQYAKLKK